MKVKASERETNNGARLKGIIRRKWEDCTQSKGTKTSLLRLWK